MILTVEILKQLKFEEAINMIFLAFHKVLKNIPTDELDQFMEEIMKKCDTQDKIELQAYHILKYVLIVEKEYRSTYKNQGTME